MSVYLGWRTSSVNGLGGLSAFCTADGWRVQSMCFSEIRTHWSTSCAHWTPRTWTTASISWWLYKMRRSNPTSRRNTLRNVSRPACLQSLLTALVVQVKQSVRCVCLCVSEQYLLNKMTFDPIFGGSYWPYLDHVWTSVKVRDYKIIYSFVRPWMISTEWKMKVKLGKPVECKKMRAVTALCRFQYGVADLSVAVSSAIVLVGCLSKTCLPSISYRPRSKDFDQDTLLELRCCGYSLTYY